MNILDNFSKVSGLIINADKTEILLLGGAKIETIPTKYHTLVKNCVKLLGVEIHSELEQTVKVNYKTAMDCMKKSIDHWSKRHMSLAGKIAVIKTMVTSKVVYIMSLLPSPPLEYWETLNSMLFSFLNNGGSDKIRRKSVIGEYADGGFNMIDIVSQNQAIKANWLFKVASYKGAWVDTIKDIYDNIDLKYLLRCNLKTKDIPFAPKQCKHWLENLKIWCKLNYREDITNWADIVNQSLWLNSHILVNNKPLWNAYWYEKGIRWLGDLLNENTGHLLTHTEFDNKFQVNSTFIEYWGIIKAIPREWRRIVRVSDRVNTEIDFVNLADKIWDSTSPVKDMYKILVKSKFIPQKDKWGKWKEDLNVDFPEEAFLRAMAYGRTATINNKLRSFHYNFFVRNVTYGVRLYHMKISRSPNCIYCGQVDTLMHRYWKCDWTIRLWNKVSDILSSYKGRKVVLTAKMALMGLVENFDKWTPMEQKLLQTVILLCKHYIHRQLCKRETTSKRGLVNYIRYIKRLEEEVATMKGSRRFHIQKWGVLHTNGI